MSEGNRLGIAFGRVNTWPVSKALVSQNGQLVAMSPASEQRLLAELFAVIELNRETSAIPIDRTRVELAFVFACEHHADQRRLSGEAFIHHPVGVAKICAGMRLDTETLCAALLHDTVEDTSASLADVRHVFGDEIANLVDGMTKLNGIIFKSHDAAQAENYRKMMVAMANDVRVILIKLADRLHNMRTIDAMSKQKQIDKAKETLEIYAPIAHRLGIHAIKWELEDLAFAALHPRKYQEIKGLVNQQRDEREQRLADAGACLLDELQALGIDADISGRAKHFYSIYSKMTRRGYEFNEIHDLTAMRVIVESVRDCYAAVGIVHPLWKPLPGRFKDFIAMPKFNMCQSLHTTVIGPGGLPLEIQIRTREMQESAEFGVAAHWFYKNDDDDGKAGPAPQGEARLRWLRSILNEARDTKDPKEFMDALKVDLSDEKVYVFTPKGEVKMLAVGATPLDFAYKVHTEVGHRCLGAKVNGRMLPLHYELRSGDVVEILTSSGGGMPTRDWLGVVRTTYAKNKIRQWFKAEARDDIEHTGREILRDQLKMRGLAHRKIVSSPLLADLIREMGFKNAADFYIALGGAKISSKIVVRKLVQRVKQRETAPQDAGAFTPCGPASIPVAIRYRGRGRGRRPTAPRQVLPAHARRSHRRLHLGRSRAHHPLAGLPQRHRIARGSRPLHAGQMGGRLREGLQRRAPSRRLGR